MQTQRFVPLTISKEYSAQDAEAAFNEARNMLGARFCLLVFSPRKSPNIAAASGRSARKGAK